LEVEIEAKSLEITLKSCTEEEDAGDDDDDAEAAAEEDMATAEEEPWSKATAETSAGLSNISRGL
jgi:hypothetical protein